MLLSIVPNGKPLTDVRYVTSEYWKFGGKLVKQNKYFELDLSL
jgi:hypothetical protein